MAIARIVLAAFAVVASGILVAGCEPTPEQEAIRRDLAKAEALLERKKTVPARRIVRAVEDRDPADWNAGLSVLAFWARAGMLHDASAAGERILQRMPRYSKPKPLSKREAAAIATQVASVLLEAGKDARAYEAMEQALRLDPTNPDALNGVAWGIAVDGGDLDRALKLARAAVDREPEAGHIVDTLGWVHFKRREYDEAVRWLRRAVKLAPNSAELREHLGQAYLARKDLPEAYVEMRKALVLDAGLPEARALQRKVMRGYNPPGPL